MLTRKINKAVITGPTGAIGTALCLELASNGIEVYAVCRPQTKRASSIPENDKIHIVYCDLSSMEKLVELIPNDIDAFYHFGWAHTIGSGRNDMSAQIKNIEYTIDAVRVAAKLGCKVFIGAGSQAEYGRVEDLISPQMPCNPENGYGIAKLCAGKMSKIECEKHGIDCVWVRILSVYGPNDSSNTMISSVIKQLLNCEKPKLTMGEQIWDYLYSGDAALAFRLIAESGVSGKTYVLGSGTAKPLREYILELRDNIDSKLPLGFGEIPYSVGQVMHLQADISDLQRDTGFAPQVNFSIGINNTIRAFREDL